MKYQVIEKRMGSDKWRSSGEEYRHLSEFRAEYHAEGLHLLDPATDYEAVPDDKNHQYPTILEEVKKEIARVERIKKSV